MIHKASALSANGHQSHFIQKTYAEHCILLQNHLRQGDHFVYTFSGTNRSVQVSLILSSDSKRFVINETEKITLRLYQLRSQSRVHYEDILIEPFYPRSCINILDMYLILANYPKFFKGILSYRVCYDFYHRFYKRWSLMFGNKSLPLGSFEEFYHAIHSLNAEQLHTLFGTMITYFDLFTSR